MKKFIAGLLALVLCFGVVGCSAPAAANTISSGGHNQVSDLPTHEDKEDEEKYSALAQEAMKTLGESEALKEFVLSEIDDIDGSGTYARNATFSVGEKELEAQFAIVDTEVTVHSISKAGSYGHFYYFPEIDVVNSYGKLGEFSLYNYHSDDKIETLNADSSDTSDFDKLFTGALSKGETLNGLCKVKLSIPKDEVESFSGIDVLADGVYYLIGGLVMNLGKLDSIPCDLLGIEIIVGSEMIGSMVVYTSSEAGLFGTSEPIITDDTYSDAFSGKYKTNAMMVMYDFQNYIG